MGLPLAHLAPSWYVTPGPFLFQAYPESDHSQGGEPLGRCLTGEHGHQGDLVSHAPGFCSSQWPFALSICWAPGTGQACVRSWPFQQPVRWEASLCVPDAETEARISIPLQLRALALERDSLQEWVGWWLGGVEGCSGSFLGFWSHFQATPCSTSG